MTWCECARGRRPRGAGEPRSWGRRVQAPRAPGGRLHDRSLWDPSPQSRQEEDSMTAACVTRPDSDLNDQMINALLFSPSAWPAQNPPLRVQQQT